MKEIKIASAADHGHCVACGHALTLHWQATGGCAMCPCDRAIEDPNGPRLHRVQSGDSAEITSTVTFSDAEQYNRYVRGEPVTFEDLIERIQELTGLNPRKASVVAAEIAELGGLTAAGEFIPLVPPDHLIVAKAKEADYLPDSWRLP